MRTARRRLAKFALAERSLPSCSVSRPQMPRCRAAREAVRQQNKTSLPLNGEHDPVLPDFSALSPDFLPVLKNTCHSERSAARKRKAGQTDVCPAEIWLSHPPAFTRVESNNCCSTARSEKYPAPGTCERSPVPRARR